MMVSTSHPQGSDVGKWLERAKAHERAGRMSLAGSIYLAVWQRDPGDVEAVRGLARVHCSRGRRPLAAKTLLRSAIVSAERGRAEAFELLREALEHGANGVDELGRFFEATLRSGSVREAAPVLEEVMQRLRQEGSADEAHTLEVWFAPLVVPRHRTDRSQSTGTPVEQPTRSWIPPLLPDEPRPAEPATPVEADAAVVGPPPAVGPPTRASQRRPAQDEASRGDRLHPAERELTAPYGVLVRAPYYDSGVIGALWDES